MKYLSWILGLIIGLIVIIYIIAFTSFGNSLLQPMIEKNIKEQTKLDTKLEVFSLSMKEIEIFLVINDSNTIEVKGNYSLFSLSFDMTYKISLDKLETLKSLTSQEINGSFLLAGKVKGSKENLVVDGLGDFASSKTSFVAVLKDFKASSLKVNIKDMNLKKLLAMLNQPHYTDGMLSLNANLTNLEPNNLKGSIVTKIDNGLLDSKYMSKTYEFKSMMPKTMYNLKADTTLDTNIVDTRLDFNSNLLNLDVESAKFNIQDSSLSTDYLVEILNLDKLFFVTQQHMKGSLSANGKVKKDKNLDLTFHTKIASGKIDAKLYNDDFKATLKGVQTLGLLKMLIYPQIFKSTLNADVDYNLAQAKGKVAGHLVDGTFTKNQVFSLIKQYARFDMYRERFNGNVSAEINKENILASLDLKSRKSSIVTKNTKLNTKTQIIDSKVTLRVNNNPIMATITGDVNKPKVKVDVEKMVEEKVKKEAEKGIKKLFKKFF